MCRTTLSPQGLCFLHLSESCWASCWASGLPLQPLYL